MFQKRRDDHDAKVLAALGRYGPLSFFHISKVSGLRATAVLRSCDRLLTSGLIQDTWRDDGRRFYETNQQTGGIPE